MNKSFENRSTKKCMECKLKDFSVFKECPEALLDELFSHKSMETFSREESLIRQGDQFKGVFCIQEGVVKVTRIGKPRKEFILWLARPGDIIGLDSFISDESYSYCATAVDEVRACFIPASDFKSIIAKAPAISIGLMKDLCDKINFIEDRITSMARKKIKEQFAEMLILLAVKNKGLREGDMEVDYSIKDLANIIGTTKNYLYKILSDFSSQKVISLRNRKLLIKDFDKLSHIAVGDEMLH